MQKLFRIDFLAGQFGFDSIGGKCRELAQLQALILFSEFDEIGQDNGLKTVCVDSPTLRSLDSYYLVVQSLQQSRWAKED